MNTIITREIEKLKSEIEKFFKKDEIGLDMAEAYFTRRIGETVRGLLAACHEKKDANFCINIEVLKKLVNCKIKLDT